MSTLAEVFSTRLWIRRAAGAPFYLDLPAPASWTQDHGALVVSTGSTVILILAPGTWIWVTPHTKLAESLT